VGFKIFPGHNDAILDFLLADDSVAKVVLFRRNVLSVYSSLVIATQTRTHKQKIGDSIAEERPRVHFTAKRFKRHCDKYLGHYRSVFERLNAYGQRFHLINYDQINDPWHFASLVTFLGEEVPLVQPRAKLIKQNPSDIVSRFANPEEVLEFLIQHSLLSWQYEAPTSLDPFGELASADDAE
jgi:LPS sulfotransferase NodH